MPRRLSVLFLFLVVFATSAPGAGADQTHRQTRDAARIRSAFAGLQDAYVHDNWGQVRALVHNQSTANSLIGSMQRWRVEGVSPLHVSMVSLTSLGHQQYAADVSFSSDPRAVPAYAVFKVAATARAIEILGSVTALKGSTYLNANWSRSQTAHFTVYHSPYQLRGADRAGLANLEHERTIFAAKFGLRLAPKIAYYLYPQQSMMRPMTRGACGTNPENVGCANPYMSPPTISTSLWPTYHEPIHVYELALEPKPRRQGGHMVFSVAPLFIAEGLAVALEDRQADPRLSDYCSDLRYIALDTCARAAAHGTNPLNLISDPGFKGHHAGDSYALGGDFVKYAILRFGYRTFGHFYYALAAQPTDHLHDYDVASRAVFREPFTAVLAQWTRALCSGPC